jgi:hypothetical protein
MPPPPPWITRKQRRSSDYHKRGQDEDIKVSFVAKYGLQAPTRIPRYLDSYNYAYLYNEALRNAGSSDRYDATALDAYRTGIDPYNYPNIDWGKEFLKKYSTNRIIT